MSFGPLALSPSPFDPLFLRLNQEPSVKIQRRETRDEARTVPKLGTSLFHEPMSRNIFWRAKVKKDASFSAVIIPFSPSSSTDKQRSPHAPFSPHCVQRQRGNERTNVVRAFLAFFEDENVELSFLCETCSGLLECCLDLEAWQDYDSLIF